MRYLCLFIIGLAGVLPLFAQPDTSLIPRAVFFQNADIHRVQLAKNGEGIYFQRHSLGDRQLVFVRATTPGREYRLALSGQLQDWRPTHTGQILAYMIGPDNRRQLLLLNAEGQLVRDLTPFPMRHLRLEALSDVRPESAAVEIVAEDPAKDGVYVVDITTGAGERLSPRMGFDLHFFNQDLQLIAAARKLSSGNRGIFIKRGESWQQLVTFPNDPGSTPGGLQQVISAGNDGKSLYLIDNHASDKAVLAEWRLDSASRRVLVADPIADILPYGAIIGSDGWPQMVMSLRPAPQHHFLQGEVRLDFEWVNERLDQQAQFLERSTDGGIWLIRKQHGGPDAYFLFRRSKRELIPLLKTPEGPPSKSLAKVHTFFFRGHENLELPVQVFLPAGKDKDQNGIPDTTLPVLIFVHDIPEAGMEHWKDWSYTRHFQLLANRGYVVLNPAFRGTTGLGREILQLGQGQWGAAIQRDLVELANWAVRHKFADPKRIGIWGWGFGGFAASAALAFSPDRFACGLSISGPADLPTYLRSKAGQADPNRNAIGDAQSPKGIEKLRQQSPYQHVDQITRPLLLTTGGRNERLSREQVDAMALRLVQTDQEVVYFYYPNEGREFQSAETWTSFWAIAERFLHQHLGGRYQPGGEEPEKSGLVAVYGKEFIEGLK